VRVRPRTGSRPGTTTPRTAERGLVGRVDREDVEREVVLGEDAEPAAMLLDVGRGR
jgi:hypothetical protein